MNSNKKRLSFFLLTAFIFVGTAQLIADELDLNGSPITVQKISTETLEKERALFEAFIESFWTIDAQPSIAQGVIVDTFSDEEKSFAQADPSTLFFHALHEDQVVGYISCDLLPGYQVRIRQFAVDPLMFDVTLIKELLFAIFAAVPKVKQVIICCPVVCLELASLFEDLGFVRLVTQDGQAAQLHAVYELNIHPKCKICDVLYADIWDTEEDVDSDWSDSSGSIDEEMGWHKEARMICPMVEDEQNTVN